MPHVTNEAWINILYRDEFNWMNFLVMMGKELDHLRGQPCSRAQSIVVKAVLGLIRS